MTDLLLRQVDTFCVLCLVMIIFKQKLFVFYKCHCSIRNNVGSWIEKTNSPVAATSILPEGQYPIWLHRESLQNENTSNVEKVMITQVLSHYRVVVIGIIPSLWQVIRFDHKIVGICRHVIDEFNHKASIYIIKSFSYSQLYILYYFF